MKMFSKQQERSGYWYLQELAKSWQNEELG